MCFPSKNQKALYSDEATKQQTPPPDTKAPASAVPPSITITPTNITSPMAPKVAIVIYSMYGHIVKCSCPISYHFILSSHPLSSTVAEAEKKGIESAGGTATIYQYAWFISSCYDLSNHALIQSRIQETLSQEILTKMYAPPKPDYPILAPSDLANFDAFILGIPTRYGNFPAQWKVGNSV